MLRENFRGDLAESLIVGFTRASMVTFRHLQQVSWLQSYDHSPRFQEGNASVRAIENRSNPWVITSAQRFSYNFFKLTDAVLFCYLHQNYLVQCSKKGV